jgi:tetratricopeptide (TPR) repeat protein
MADTFERSFSTLVEWLQRGQKLEAEAQLNEAIAAYDQVIESLRGAILEGDIERRRLLGLAWMNRGNALQKIAPTPQLDASVRAYDEAISLFESLPLDSEPAFRNHLGAAWLNRGHALILAADTSSAKSFEQAIGHFEQLPPSNDPYFRLNLAGAWTNLAHARLRSMPESARVAARRALTLLAGVEHTHENFAAMSLRARRALAMSLGEILRATNRESVADLVSEATDAIEEGLSLARDFEGAGYAHFRPLAARLFQMGAQLYRVQQPHFLSEFILENLAAPGFATDPEFRAIAAEALEAALVELKRPQLFIAGSSEADRMLDTARSLRATQQRLTDAPPPAPPPAFTHRGALT